MLPRVLSRKRKCYGDYERKQILEAVEDIDPDTFATSEDTPRDSRETAERQPRDRAERETAERHSRDTAERQPRGSREAAERGDNRERQPID